MPQFKIEWENELYNCKTPLEAAKECAQDIANGDTLRFTVTNLSTGEKWSVDLNELEGEEVIEMNND